MASTPAARHSTTNPARTIPSCGAGAHLVGAEDDQALMQMGLASEIVLWYTITLILEIRRILMTKPLNRLKKTSWMAPACCRSNPGCRRTPAFN
jgi:hypothetical protein